jgi:hypothetical protein
MKSGCLKIVMFLGLIVVVLAWLGKGSATGLGAGLVAMLGYGIVLGAIDNTNFYDRSAQIVAIDRRCVTASSHINRFADMPSNSCSPEDIASRLAVLNAPVPAPIRDGNGIVTEYPGKRQPQPGAAIISIRYTDKNAVSRTGTLTYSTQERGFYSRKVGDTVSIMVCRNNPSVIKTSILFHPKC